MNKLKAMVEALDGLSKEISDLKTQDDKIYDKLYGNATIQCKECGSLKPSIVDEKTRDKYRKEMDAINAKIDAIEKEADRLADDIVDYLNAELSTERVEIDASVYF